MSETLEMKITEAMDTIIKIIEKSDKEPVISAESNVLFLNKKNALEYGDKGITVSDDVTKINSKGLVVDNSSLKKVLIASLVYINQLEDTIELTTKSMNKIADVLIETNKYRKLIQQ